MFLYEIVQVVQVLLGNFDAPEIVHHMENSREQSKDPIAPSLGFAPSSRLALTGMADKLRSARLRPLLI
jgi:hypothetical protein